MIESAKIHGMPSPITVKTNQELDTLLLLLLLREQNSQIIKN